MVDLASHKTGQNCAYGAEDKIIERTRESSIMASNLENQPFKNREQIIAEIRRCALAGTAFQYLSFLFAALGAISGVLNTALGLQSTLWLLLAIFASLHGIVPHMHLVAAKHLLGVESESKMGF
jgi:hypothetical protein